MWVKPKSRARKTKSTFPIWVLLCIGVFGLGALAAYVKYSGAATVLPEDRLRVAGPQGKSAEQPKSVTVLKPHYEDDKLLFNKEEHPVPEGVNAMVFSVNQFLEKSQVAPKDARAVSCSVKDGVATIEFSKAFDRTYGTEDEHTLLDGILTTMGQFGEVESVQFDVEGQPLETLGNVDLTTPQPVMRPASHP